MSVHDAIAKVESIAEHLEDETAAEAKKLYHAFMAELRKVFGHAPAPAADTVEAAPAPVTEPVAETVAEPAA